MTTTKTQRYCKPCDSKTHDESQCWGVCPHCGQRGHQGNFCRFKKNNDQNQSAPQAGRADKVAPKNKKKKKRAGKGSCHRQRFEERE